ncbi:hypothetical protein [Streptosporangium sp. NPDC049644]|uniref:hypothetical protein n=1 Tax=Streptosporangium sp. NPDC049644 TaxID=3155507 RepID=UPI003418055A
MRKRLPLVVAGWLVTGLLATGAGVAVIDHISEPLTTAGLRPLSAAEVDEALVLASSLPGAPSTAPTAVGGAGNTPSPAPTASATPAADTGKSRVIATAGGRVIARCENGLVTLRSWSPAQGFQVDDVERGPDARARVEFESEETEVKVEVHCSADGLPVHRVHT